MTQAKIVANFVGKDYAILRRLPPAIALVLFGPEAVHMNPAGTDPSLASTTTRCDLRGDVDLDQVVGSRPRLQRTKDGIDVGLDTTHGRAGVLRHGHAGHVVAGGQLKRQSAVRLLLIPSIEFSHHVLSRLGRDRCWGTVDGHRDNGHIVEIGIVCESAKLTVSGFRDGQRVEVGGGSKWSASDAPSADSCAVSLLSEAARETAMGAVRVASRATTNATAMWLRLLDSDAEPAFTRSA